MIFKDSIEIQTRVKVGEDHYGEPIYEIATVETVPAHVDVERTTGATHTTQNLTNLVVYCRPFAYDPTKHRIRWRGTDYQADGPMIERTALGRNHHVEIPLKLYG